MKLNLVVLTPGKQEGKVLEIRLPQFVVGRDPQCHLRPASPLISKRHCAILQREGKAFVRDFDSTNGTFVNDQPVKGQMELHNGDQLKIGPLLFAVQIEAGVAVNQPTPLPATKQVATPAPATKAAPAKAAEGEGQSEEDDIAAMLLSLQDEGDTGVQSLAPSGEIPDGSTVLDMKMPSDMETAAPKPDAKDKAKSSVGNTSAAAKSILEKYMKRPRTS